MASAFKPIFSDFWLNIFTWLFIIVAVGSLIWFILYIKNSKNQKTSTTISVMLFTSFAVALALQLLMVRERVNL